MNGWIAYHVLIAVETIKVLECVVRFKIKYKVQRANLKYGIYSFRRYLSQWLYRSKLLTKVLAYRIQNYLKMWLNTQTIFISFF